MADGKTIVVGLGNPLLGDDSVGLRVAEQAAPRARELGAEVDTLAAGGLRLMEALVGYRRAIIVDAIHLNDAPVGTVRCFPLDALENTFVGHLGSEHETNLHMALEMGRMLGAELPEEVLVVAIESPYVYDFNEELTPPVAAAVPQAIQMVADLLVAHPSSLIPKQEG